MHIDGQFCDPGSRPYLDVAVRRIRPCAGDGEQPIVAPVDWPLAASQALAAMDRPRPATQPAAGPRGLPAFLQEPGLLPEPGATRPEPDVLAILDRISRRWARWGWRLGLFDEPGDARAFFDDVRWLLARRAIAPDTVAWLGASGAQALRGFGIDPTSGAVAPAHALADFAPVDPGPLPDGPVDGVVRLIRDAVGARGDKPAVPAPVVTLDLMRFLGRSGALDAAALAHAARLATVIAEIELSTRAASSEAQARAVHSQRPVAIGPANLGAFLVSQGLAHDSDAGRALAQATVGLITAACAAASAGIAATVGPCPAFTVARRPLAAALQAQCEAAQAAVARVAAVVRPAGLAASADALAAVSAPLWAEALTGAGRGLRHSRLTAVQPADHRPLPIGLESLGVRGLAGLTVDQERSDGRMIRVVQPAVLAGLASLGYGVKAQAAAIRRLRGHRSLADAPGVTPASLRAKGLDEAALAESADVRHVFTRWVLGPDTCDRGLGLDPALSADYGYDLLAALGFPPEAIEAANRHCYGTDRLDGVAGISASDAKALALPADAAAASEAEARMIRALNAVISVPAAIPEAAPVAAVPPSQTEEPASAATALALATAERS